MKTKIIGIALAAIMLVSIFGAMVPTSARTDATHIQSGDTVFIGEQGLIFPVTGSLEGVTGTNTEDASPITISAGMTIPSTIKGKYFVDANSNNILDATEFFCFIDEATITGDVILNSAAQDTVAGKNVPTSSEIVFKVQTNVGGKIPGAKVDIKVIDPDGVEVTSIDGQTLNDVTLLGTTHFLGDPASTTTAPAYADALDMTSMKLGTYKVTFKLDKTTCNLLDKSSSEMTFTVRSEELSIEAAAETVGKGKAMVLTVKGNPSTHYYLTVTDIKETEPPAIQLAGDVKVLSGANVFSAAAPNLAAWIKTSTSGIASVKVSTSGADERTYKVNVYSNPNGLKADPNSDGVYSDAQWVQDAAITTKDDDADVKVTVEKATVEFDVPTKVIIGEEMKIKGVISAGTYVDVIVKDQERVVNDKAVDEAKEFEVKWDTSGSTVGSYTIEVYIDDRKVLNTYPGDYAAVDPDGKTTIRLIEPGLTAEQVRNAVAEGDDYTLKGTATGVTTVDYILVGPKGWKAGATTTGIMNGLVIASATVTDDEFEEDETMTEGLDTGTWIAGVLHPGRDGAYSTPITAAALGITAGKSQSQILAIVEDRVTAAGSDDLFEMLSFKVESGYVRLNPVADVAKGEPINISGVTNREPDTTISISTFSGPTDLLALADVEWPTADRGVFSATIDTTDAKEGTYTLEADDGDGNTDSVTVNIGAAKPSPTATATPTATPATPTPTVPPTATPATPTPATPTPATPTPKTPGFEAVFAIAGLLAIAYLVLRIRK